MKKIFIAILMLIMMATPSSAVDLDSDRDGKVDLIYIPDLSSIYQTIMGADDNYVTGAQLAALDATISATHSILTLGTTSDIFSLSTQQLNLDTQTAHYIFAGPTGGAAAAPTFRALVAGDIPDMSSYYQVVMGLDDNYVTDAEKTVIGNTSGVNTGDQDAADVAVTDTDENFTATEVESALAELADNVMSQADAETGTSTTSQLVAPAVLKAAVIEHAPAASLPQDLDTTDSPEFVSVSQGVNAIGSAAAESTKNIPPGVSTITNGGAHTLTFTGWPADIEATARVYYTNGGAYTITWPAGAKFEGGVEPSTIMPASGASLLTITSHNAGTTAYVMIAGEDLQ